MIGLTPRQKQLFAFIQGEMLAGRPFPSFRAMGEGIGCRNMAGVHRAVVGLEERGYVFRTKIPVRVCPPRRTFPHNYRIERWAGIRYENPVA